MGRTSLSPVETGVLPRLHCYQDPKRQLVKRHTLGHPDALGLLLQPFLHDQEGLLGGGFGIRLIEDGAGDVVQGIRRLENAYGWLD
jgi:hypothetical protein